MSLKKILESGYFYIKPAANHILTIGKGIIKDPYTAILELVKNSYDADAENVYIKLSFTENKARIIIEDDGHGMNYRIVTEKWMVPSTQDKLRQRKSKIKRRPLQGRKGIGRYASSILGDDLLMKTTDADTFVTTELYLDWTEFLSDSKFLEDIEILIESYSSNNSKGTYLDITGTRIWTDYEINELISSLRRLLSPFDDIDSDFNIYLEIKKNNSEKYIDFSEKIKPLPVLEYYHYRIYGTIDFIGEDEKGNNVLFSSLIIENKSLKNILPVKIEKRITLNNESKYSSQIKLDIRAFDLDEEFKMSDLTQEESKKQLKELPGVAVIKDGFRVRPYGDKKVDWLGLNERRFNNPTLRLSNNQVAGFITVLQEEESHLEEKASREGFKENEYYEGLVTIIRSCLSELELLRQKFRKQHNKGGRKPKSLNEQIDNVANFDSLNNKIHSLFKESNLSEEVFTKVKKVIDEEAKAKEEEFEEIKKTIARYQGQVTLGKILTVVFHEGRKPLNALKQHPSFIKAWGQDFIKAVEKDQLLNDKNLKILYDKILDRLNDNKSQAEFFINIFKKLEPLANTKRASPKEFEIATPLMNSFKIFESELIKNSITYSIEGDTWVKFVGWEIDFQLIFTNLIENSIYWMRDSHEKNIKINFSDLEDKIVIDYQDTGTGIDEENITNQDIFDPGFTTKDEGSGLGLSIAGEALERNNGKIEALSSANGANFIIKLNKP
ncbi:ATP-binding protein [Chryseobacterium sp. PS-8]|uniref:histidine kinase n=1 Tax=Chryseobacterium indicum TaxID=2766954 RepID=A0ABS9C1U3_9FLAO|nr:sensor histidine kinase [Chryseobacterium sp. PS-8]MCF2218198.1 ATP-binding protein [Chryseobacterium sp. PS-8]